MASHRLPLRFMNSVRLGIIGLGNMGAAHVRSLQGGSVPGLTVAAVCDNDPARLTFGPAIPAFTDSHALINSGEVDAVLIATPHYSHTDLGIAALASGLHVLVEKPISVHKADCERLITAHAGRKQQVFAAMFNQRTDPFYQKIRSLIQHGELRRVNWIITGWFRTQACYVSGGWRATWAGEGGGVLLNQCPHNLDLLQWMFGMPMSVRAFCRLGRYHDIEVEDDVTAYLEFPNGASGVFITSTGEFPGSNRLEITGERGKLVHENDRLTFTRNEEEMTKFSHATKLSFTAPPVWEVNIPVPGKGEQHVGILKNFADAILHQSPLIAPAAEGIRSVELANAMLLSSFTGETIHLPMDAEGYATHLKKLVAGSRAKVPSETGPGPASDFSHSFK